MIHSYHFTEKKSIKYYHHCWKFTRNLNYSLFLANIYLYLILIITVSKYEFTKLSANFTLQLQLKLPKRWKHHSDITHKSYCWHTAYLRSAVKHTAGEIKTRWALLQKACNCPMFRDWYETKTTKPGLQCLILFKSLTFCMNKEHPTKVEHFGHCARLSSFGEKQSKTQSKLNELRLTEHHTTVNHSERKLGFTME